MSTELLYSTSRGGYAKYKDGKYVWHTAPWRTRKEKDPTIKIGDELTPEWIATTTGPIEIIEGTYDAADEAGDDVLELTFIAPPELPDVPPAAPVL